MNNQNHTSSSNDINCIPESDCLGRRISIVGTMGSGKTTLSINIARLTVRPHIELDSLYWESDWKPANTSIFRHRVDEALRGPKWIADGNYSESRDIVFERADMVIFLDYPLWIVATRLIMRSFYRSFNRTRLWNSNRETFAMGFAGRNSLLGWMIRTHARNKTIYSNLFKQSAYSHLRVIRFGHPREARTWIKALRCIY